jgi:hypothetical protein
MIDNISSIFANIMHYHESPSLLVLRLCKAVRHIVVAIATPPRNPQGIFHANPLLLHLLLLGLMERVCCLAISNVFGPRLLIPVVLLRLVFFLWQIHARAHTLEVMTEENRSQMPGKNGAIDKESNINRSISNAV